MDIITRDPYHPWRAIDRLHRDAGAFWRPFHWPTAPARNSAGWVPAVDIEEEAERFVIRADVPGIDAEDLEITITEGLLTLRGKREAHRQANEAGRRRTERLSGGFARSFSLPETADPSRIDAVCHNGVLQITIAKQRQAEPRRIEVKAG